MPSSVSSLDNRKIIQDIGPREDGFSTRVPLKDRRNGSRSFPHPNPLPLGEGVSALEARLLPECRVLGQEQRRLSTRLAVEIPDRTDLPAMRGQMADLGQKQRIGGPRPLGEWRQKALA